MGRSHLPKGNDDDANNIRRFRRLASRVLVAPLPGRVAVSALLRFAGISSSLRSSSDDGGNVAAARSLTTPPPLPKLDDFVVRLLSGLAEAASACPTVYAAQIVAAVLARLDCDPAVQPLLLAWPPTNLSVTAATADDDDEKENWGSATAGGGGEARAACVVDRVLEQLERAARRCDGRRRDGATRVRAVVDMAGARLAQYQQTGVFVPGGGGSTGTTHDSGCGSTSVAPSVVAHHRHAQVAQRDPALSQVSAAERITAALEAADSQLDHAALATVPLAPAALALLDRSIAAELLPPAQPLKKSNAVDPSPLAIARAGFARFLAQAILVHRAILRVQILLFAAGNAALLPAVSTPLSPGSVVAPARRPDPPANFLRLLSVCEARVAVRLLGTRPTAAAAKRSPMPSQSSPLPADTGASCARSLLAASSTSSVAVAAWHPLSPWAALHYVLPPADAAAATAHLLDTMTAAVPYPEVSPGAGAATSAALCALAYLCDGAMGANPARAVAIFLGGSMSGSSDAGVLASVADIVFAVVTDAVDADPSYWVPWLLHWRFANWSTPGNGPAAHALRLLVHPHLAFWWARRSSLALRLLSKIIDVVRSSRHSGVERKALLSFAVDGLASAYAESDDLLGDVMVAVQDLNEDTPSGICSTIKLATSPAFQSLAVVVAAAQVGKNSSSLENRRAANVIRAAAGNWADFCNALDSQQERRGVHATLSAISGCFRKLSASSAIPVPNGSAGLAAALELAEAALRADGPFRALAASCIRMEDLLPFVHSEDLTVQCLAVRAVAALCCQSDPSAVLVEDSDIGRAFARLAVGPALIQRGVATQSSRLRAQPADDPATARCLQTATAALAALAAALGGSERERERAARVQAGGRPGCGLATAIAELLRLDTVRVAAVRGGFDIAVA
ncbi:hypothetical protein HK405_004560, partial [Cladochytrium tenue]